MEGGYTFIRRYTLPVIRDDEGIVPYGFYRDPRMNGGGRPSSVTAKPCHLYICDRGESPEGATPV